MAKEGIRNHAAFIWSVADKLRGVYEQSEYGRVILPLVVIRRLECVLEPTKAAVLERHAALAGRVEDGDALTKPGIVRTLFDPACGTGGMLSVAEDYVRELNPDARLDVFGHELNEETYAVCRSDMMLKGQDAPTSPGQLVRRGRPPRPAAPSRRWRRSSRRAAPETPDKRR